MNLTGFVIITGFILFLSRELGFNGFTFRYKTHKKGDTREVIKFCWIPKKVEDGEYEIYYWLCKVKEYQEYNSYEWITIKIEKVE